jgi:hypothetical protein
MMKAVTLPAATWDAICAALDDAASVKDFAAMIREQTSGKLKVRAIRGGANVTLTAPKGGDLRGVIEAMTGHKFPV